MSKVDIWMPLYIGDYIRDTMRLTTEQHGAYLLLLMEHWIAEELPNDDEELAAIAKLSPERWEKVKAKIERFFDVTDDKWIQSRLVHELEESKKRREIAAENGKKGGRPRKPKNPNETQKKPTGFDSVSETPGFENPDHNPEHNPQESSSSSPSPSSSSLSSQPSSEDPFPYQRQDVSTGYVDVDPETGEIIEFPKMGGVK